MIGLPRENGVKNCHRSVIVALWHLSVRAIPAYLLFARPGAGREASPARGVSVSDVVFVLLTVGLFAALAFVVRGVEKL